MNNKKLKELIFCFENLEQLTVPASCVEGFFFFNLHKDIHGYFDSDVIEMTCAEEAFVMLRPEAEDKAVSSFPSNGALPFWKLFNRLESDCDCVGIDLLYNDNSKEEIYVPWEDGRNEFTNGLQETFTQDNDAIRGKGCFCVYFGKSKRIMNRFLGKEGAEDTEESVEVLR